MGTNCRTSPAFRQTSNASDDFARWKHKVGSPLCGFCSTTQTNTKARDKITRWEIQNGTTPSNASPFELSAANEVMKLTERHDGDTYRCVYAAKFEKVVYVLHVFQKKSRRGIATPKQEIDLVFSRLERAKADYAAAFPPETAHPAPPAVVTQKKEKRR